jgi:hypothetical protein
MKHYNVLSFVLASLLLLAVGSSIVSADNNSNLSITKLQEMSFTQNGTFTLTNIGTVDLTNIAFTSSGAFTVGFTPSQIDSLVKGATSPTITVTPISLSNLKFGTNTITVTAKDLANTAQAATQFSVTKSFCESGAAGGNLSITKAKINNEDGKDSDWKLRNRITVEVKVRNDGTNTVKDVSIDLGLFDDQGNDRSNDLDFISSDEQTSEVGSISDGNDETVTFEFQVPVDMVTGNYRLAVKAYSTSLGETKECTDTSSSLNSNVYQDINIDPEDKKERFISIENIDMPTQAVCGSPVSGSFQIFNVGEDNQDQILVKIDSAQLGLRQEIESKTSLDQGEDRKLDFHFNVPSNLKDGTYTVNFKPQYDYRNGVYREESEETFTASLAVIGCNFVDINNQASPIVITASLDSEVKAGSKLVVSSIIKNSGTGTLNVILDAKGFQSWSSLDSISKRVLTLAPGQSESITLTFNVNADVSGSKSFLIEASANGSVESQEVEVKFPTATTSDNINFSSLTSGSGLIWLIIAVNVVLVLLIVFAVIKIARR